MILISWMALKRAHFSTCAAKMNQTNARVPLDTLMKNFKLSMPEVDDWMCRCAKTDSFMSPALALDNAYMINHNASTDVILFACKYL